MVCTSCQYPGSTTCFHIRVWFPQDSRHRQLWKIMFWLYSFHFIYQKPETIAHIYNRGIKCGTTLDIKHEANRISFSANTKSMYLARNTSPAGRQVSVSDRRTYFEHVRTQHHLIARFKMISIIFHKG